MANGRTSNSSNQRWPIRTRQVRELLRYCLPALLLGLALRVVMTWQMPYGYMQFDSADFLMTANRFFTKGTFVLHSKRTFLVPILYTVPFLIRIPALILIPIAQHLLGLAVILMTGALTRLWVREWRRVIVPVTLVMAANPNLLWFEHALMSESVYLCCVFTLALAGTLYTQRQSVVRFTLLLLALFFTAGARPEGRLLLGFGFLLIVLLGWRNWKMLAWRMGWLVGLAMVTLPLTRTGQGGQLLYATVLPLAPDVSRVDPEFAREVIPLRDQIRAQGGVNTELQSLEQELADMSSAYLEAKGMGRDSNEFCQSLAVEASLNQPSAVPVLAWKKFLLSTKHPVSIGYSEPPLEQKLNVGFNRKNMLGTLSRGLVGRSLNDEAAVADFVEKSYHPLSWYSFLGRSWRWLTTGMTDDSRLPGGFRVPSLPIFFIVSFAGMAIVAMTPGPFQRFHIAWILSLGGLWFAVQLTGVVNARYRFVFEPFCLLYAVHGLAVAWMRLRQCFRAAARQASGVPALVAQSGAASIARAHASQ